MQKYTKEKLTTQLQSWVRTLLNVNIHIDSESEPAAVDPEWLIPAAAFWSS